MAVLAAVAVRFLTPVGWMPNPNGAGGPAFVICTADGPRLAKGLDLPGHAPDRKAGHDHCLFAGFAPVGGPERFASVTDGPIFHQILWLPGEQHRRQFPRGPPGPV